MVSQSSVECSWYEAYPLQRRSNMWVTKHMTSRRVGISAPTICRGLPVLWVTGHSSCPGARATCWSRSSLIALCHRSQWRQLSEIPACGLTARPAGAPLRHRSPLYRYYHRPIANAAVTTRPQSRPSATDADLIHPRVAHRAD